MLSKSKLYPQTQQQTVMPNGSVMNGDGLVIPKHNAQIVYIHLNDLRTGPIYINQPGIYQLQVSCQDIDWSNNQASHDYFEAILIRSNNVKINLNGFTLSFSENMLALNPEIALIRVDPRVSHRGLTITNGTLGRTAYSLYVPHTEGVLLQDLQFRQFSRAGVVVAGDKTPLMERVSFDSKDGVIQTSELYECLLRNVFLANVVLGNMMMARKEVQKLHQNPTIIDDYNNDQEFDVDDESQKSILEKLLEHKTNIANKAWDDGRSEGSSTFHLFYSFQSDEINDASLEKGQTNSKSYNEIAAIVMDKSSMRAKSTTATLKDVKVTQISSRRKQWKGLCINDSNPLRDPLGYLVPKDGIIDQTDDSVCDDTSKPFVCLAELQLALLACLYGVEIEQDQLPKFSPRPWSSDDVITSAYDLDFRGLPLHSSPIVEFRHSDGLKCHDLSITNIDFSETEMKSFKVFSIDSSDGVSIQSPIITDVYCVCDLDLVHLGKNCKNVTINDVIFKDIVSTDGTVCGVGFGEGKINDTKIQRISMTKIQSPFLYHVVYYSSMNRNPLTIIVNPSPKEDDDSTSDPTKASLTQISQNGIVFKPLSRLTNTLGKINHKG